MKNFFTLFIALLLGGSAYAQSAISACNDPEGGIQIFFFEANNCPAAPGDLAGQDTIGFHSGANQWANVVAWDAATALNAINMGGDTFRVYIADAVAYYGASAVDNIFFVFNQGPTDSANPWASEGKADNGAGGCADFSVVIADITETCRTSATTSIRDAQLDLGLSVAPNPMRDRALLRFSNPVREALDVTVMSLDGRVVRRYAEVRGESLTIERDNLPTGLYFVHFVNPAGQHTATSLMVE